MDREEVIRLLKSQHDDLHKRFGVKSLSVFGSVARAESKRASDVDILVEFEGRATFDAFMGLRFHLEDLLGIRVDLVTQKALRPQMRATVEREAIRVA